MLKLISGAVGLATLVAVALGSIAYFQPRSEATEKHLQMTEYSEIAALENELKLTILEIDSILKMGAQNQRDTNQLEYLNAKRLNLESRLRELQGA
jgi:hypothetical protein